MGKENNNTGKGKSVVEKLIDLQEAPYSPTSKKSLEKKGYADTTKNKDFLKWLGL